MAQTRRILIIGYYGFSNAGDEAVLSAIVSGLKSELDHVEITVLSASPDETERTHGVRAVSRTSMPCVSRALRECDLLISGGGSLIQDATSFRSLAYYLSVMRLAKFYRRRVMVLGQGIGPLRRSMSRRLAGRVLNGADLITVRDASSAELLKNLGVRRPSVQVTADPTFLLDPCWPDEAAELIADVGLTTEDDLIAVSLRRWPEAAGIEKSAAEALRILAGQLPAKLLLLTMHTPYDYSQARELQEAVPEIAVQPDLWTPEQLLGVLGRCRLVVGMRLHALIFAASVGVPSLGITYDPKVEHFLAATGQESITLDNLDAKKLVKGITEAWDNRDVLSSRLVETVPSMRESAHENIRLAAELLNRS